MKTGNAFKNEAKLNRDERKTGQGFVDLKNLSLHQLDELIKRQNKLLLNRCVLEKLPDKGNKISSFKAILEIEYKKKQQEYETTCQLLCNLSLKDDCIEEIEWNQGKLNISEEKFSNDTNVDEEKNPLKLIASHSGTASGKKCPINSCENRVIDRNVDKVKKQLYVDKFCEKYKNSSKIKERFQPNQLKNNDKTLFVTSAENIKKRLGNKWEITQATPPVPIYKNAVMIGLLESLKLQKDQADKLREIEKKQATEKLLQNLSIRMGDEMPINNITKYRNSQNCFDESADDEEENTFTDSDS